MKARHELGKESEEDKGIFLSIWVLAIASNGFYLKGTLREIYLGTQMSKTTYLKNIGMAVVCYSVCFNFCAVSSAQIWATLFPVELKQADLFYLVYV